MDLSEFQASLFYISYRPSYFRKKNAFESAREVVQRLIVWTVLAEDEFSSQDPIRLLTNYL